MNTSFTQTADGQSIAQHITGMEKAALERWNQGDPSGFLENSANDVVYFDPFTAQRVDGHEALTALYESIRGQIHVDRYDMLNPRVQCVEGMAVLTFNLISHMGTTNQKWNCTEVYRLDDGQWRIIQTHWSLTQPALK